MAFPWELNIDRPYEKLTFPEGGARSDSTDWYSAASLRKSTAIRQKVKSAGVAERFDQESPASARC
jgi:hypothetical protein